MDFRPQYEAFFEKFGLNPDSEFLEKIDGLAENLNWSASDISDMRGMKDIEEVLLFFFYAFGAKQVREKLGWEVPKELRYFKEIELPLRERDPNNSYAFLISSTMQFQPASRG